MTQMTLERPSRKAGEKSAQAKAIELLAGKAVSRLNCDLPVDLHKKIRVKCATDEVTQSEVVIRLLEEWLEKG